MLVLVADYCPWCRKFERKTLQEPSIDTFIQNNYIPLIVDRNLDKAKYPKIYDTPRIPVVFFIDPRTESHLYESIGYVKKKAFALVLEDVLKMQQQGAQK